MHFSGVNGPHTYSIPFAGCGNYNGKEFGCIAMRFNYLCTFHMKARMGIVPNLIKPTLRPNPTIANRPTNSPKARYHAESVQHSFSTYHPASPGIPYLTKLNNCAMHK
jgi:hypothetical protein